LTVTPRITLSIIVSLKWKENSVAVFDDPVSVEATSLSDVTGSDTRLH